MSATTSGPVYPAPATVPIDPGLLERVLERLAQEAQPTPAKPSAPRPQTPPPLPDRSHMASTVKLDLSTFPEPSVVIDRQALAPEPPAAPTIVVSPELLPSWPTPRQSGPIQLTEVVDLPPRDWTAAWVLAGIAALGLLTLGVAWALSPSAAPDTAPEATLEAPAAPVVPAAVAPAAVVAPAPTRLMPEVDLRPAATAATRPAKPAAAPVLKAAAAKPAPRAAPAAPVAAPRRAAPAPKAPAEPGTAQPTLEPAHSALPGAQASAGGPSARAPLTMNCPEAKPAPPDLLGARE